MQETYSHPTEPDQASPQEHSLIESSADFEILANPYDRMEYVHLTDRLIHRLEGTEDKPRPDFVIFLDKSARPVAWLTRELWPTLAREPGTDYEEGKVPEKPKFLFLNIDSKHNFSREDIPRLRSLFTVEPVDEVEEAMAAPSYFDGGRILVVDEIGVSHATRVKAQAYVEMAFPEAEVDSFTWMDQGPQTNFGGQGAPPTFNRDTFEFEGDYHLQGRQLDNNLRWYRDRSHLPNLPVEQRRDYDDGRGIIDLDAATDEEMASLDRPRTRHGKSWLSARPKEMLPKSKQLMKEIKAIGEELRKGTLPYWPDSDRDDFEDRVELFNQIPAANFTEFREWFKRAWWINWKDALPAIKTETPDRFAYKSARNLGSHALSLARRHGLYKD